jgi:capsular polysaccharide biosynthesis protein
MLSELPQESSNESSEQQQAMASNPIYIEVAAKIDATKREVSRMRQRQNELRERLAEYEQRVYKTNQVQRAYLDLTRDHENKLNQYRELRAKQLEAELAQTLESESKGESFVLIEPPRVSAKPEKPDRPKLMAMAFVGSLGAGAGMAILIELLFGGIRGYSQISQLVGKTPLVVIPVITTEHDKRKKRTNRIRLFILFIILAIAGIAVIHFYVMNLEVLWFKVMNKLNVL